MIQSVFVTNDLNRAAGRGDFPRTRASKRCTTKKSLFYRY